MREIEGQITQELKDHIGNDPIARVDAYLVTTYRQLVEHVARLAYLNKDYLLFFRGQGDDFRNKAGASTFYPGIYRGEYLPQREIINRFSILDSAAEKLKDIFFQERIQGYEEVRWKKYIQWGILQHYEVCQTPLIHFTQSLRVACSFAQLGAEGPHGYVYAFGLPYVMNRISHNSEHDIVNVRLLSICPPEALRPYFQEGYLAATEDITTNYDPKTTLDFKNRLIAKFKIPRRKAFWGPGFSMIPESVLYPKGDRIEHLCRDINADMKSQLLPGQLGEFVQAWTNLEEILVASAKRFEETESKIISVRRAIDIMAKQGVISQESAYELHELRKFRNVVVHEPQRVSPGEVEERVLRVNELIPELKRL
jgi:uncharacterized protein YutE (UPF0331/DUF86 family)